jgi:hypothetical protein
LGKGKKVYMRPPLKDKTLGKRQGKVLETTAQGQNDWEKARKVLETSVQGQNGWEKARKCP